MNGEVKVLPKQNKPTRPMKPAELKDYMRGLIQGKENPPMDDRLRTVFLVALNTFTGIPQQQNILCKSLFGKAQNDVGSLDAGYFMIWIGFDSQKHANNPEYLQSWAPNKHALDEAQALFKEAGYIDSPIDSVYGGINERN